MSNNKIIHGATANHLTTKEYRVWAGMKRRCSDPKHKSYKNYALRGIGVCKEWQNSFPTFLKDMGLSPSIKHSIERVDNNLGYCKSNCIWATNKEQGRNKRNNVVVFYNGVRTIQADWYGIFPICSTSVDNKIGKIGIYKMIEIYKIENIEIVNGKPVLNDGINQNNLKTHSYGNNNRGSQG